MYYYYEHTQHCAPFHVINEFVHTIPAVISIPHSGTYLTQQMKTGYSTSQHRLVFTGFIFFFAAVRIYCDCKPYQ